jgi:hypothetical protein
LNHADIVEFSIDMLDDASIVIPVVVCHLCADSVPVSQGGTVTGTRAESPDFPYIAPTCERCFREWRSSR